MDAQIHSKELSITREFNAPRDLVFKAWTDPKIIAQWFGPAGFTNPVCKCEPRVGGEIHVVMRANDEIAKSMGFRDAPMRGVFQEVTPPEKLVFTNNAVDADDNIVLDGLTTVRFEDIGGNKTRMHFHTRAQGTLPQVVFMLQGMEAGWTQSFDKMDAMFAGKA
jgi:uncharacterized protein YndB with AHSA1/START domain